MKSPLERSSIRPRTQILLGILGACLLLTVAFSLGVVIGARNTPRSAAPYAPRPDWGAPIDRQVQPVPRGAYGSITAVGNGMLTVVDRRTGRPLQIRIGARTVIERGRQRRIPAQELRIGDPVFIVGSPMPGAIEAEFIGVIHQQPFNFRRAPDSDTISDPGG